MTIKVDSSALFELDEIPADVDDDILTEIRNALEAHMFAALNGGPTVATIEAADAHIYCLYATSAGVWAEVDLRAYFTDRELNGRTGVIRIHPEDPTEVLFTKAVSA